MNSALSKKTKIHSTDKQLTLVHCSVMVLAETLLFPEFSIIKFSNKYL